jgi:hypothetical protein
VEALVDCHLLTLEGEQFVAAVTGEAESTRAADLVVSQRLADCARLSARCERAVDRHAPLCSAGRWVTRYAGCRPIRRLQHCLIP